MRINGEITLLMSEEGMTIELYDSDAKIAFLRIELDQKQTCKALSRVAYTNCKNVEIYGIKNVGKIREVKELVFDMPESTWSNRKEVAQNKVHQMCPDGWVPETRFSSQDSFFAKEGINYARTIIMHWVDKQEDDEIS
jgi:hypothetical protein